MRFYSFALSITHHAFRSQKILIPIKTTGIIIVEIIIRIII